MSQRQRMAIGQIWKARQPNDPTFTVWTFIIVARQKQKDGSNVWLAAKTNVPVELAGSVAAFDDSGFQFESDDPLESQCGGMRFRLYGLSRAKTSVVVQ